MQDTVTDFRLGKFKGLSGAKGLTGADHSDKQYNSCQKESFLHKFWGLRSYDRTVPFAYSPSAGLIRDGIFGGQFFVDVHAQSGSFIDIQVSLLHFGAARENFAELIGKKTDSWIPKFQMARSIWQCTAWPTGDT